MQNLRALTETIIADKIPGDLIETGVWRGGACILMRGLLAVHGETERKVIVADSFEGLPRPDTIAYPAETTEEFHQYAELAVSLETVKANFAAYGLLDDQVEFLKGWFKDTLPTLADRQFALVRLDGDMYQSTTEALENLYNRLSPGGVIIIDDYGAVPACRQAVEVFRAARNIIAPIEVADWTGVWWRKPLSS
jgi:O-methyltransferase